MPKWSKDFMPVLRIKDQEAYELATELARRSGGSLAEVVKQALREKLDRERDHRTRIAQRLLDLGEEAAQLPIIDPRSQDEIIGYDEFGVPR